MFFDEEIQQDDTEPVDKPFKENTSQDVGELSSEEKERKMDGKLIEKEEDEEKRRMWSWGSIIYYSVSEWMMSKVISEGMDVFTKEKSN